MESSISELSFSAVFAKTNVLIFDIHGLLQYDVRGFEIEE